MSVAKIFARAALGIILLVLTTNAFLKADNLNCTVSWIGNDFSGRDAWVLMTVGGIFVDSDGTLFTNTGWDEAGGNVEEYNSRGDFVASAGHTHGWGYDGGDAVAANSKYVFIAERGGNENGGLVGNSWPPKGKGWSGICRRLRSDIKKGAPFPGGHGQEGDVIPHSFLPILTISDKETAPIRGLWATETRVYVSCPYDNTIKVFDCEMMQLIGSSSVERPDRLCVDSAGKVWVLERPEQEGGSWKVIGFSDNGTRLPTSLTLPPEVIPGAMCFDNQNRLLIGDDGIDDQVKIYGGMDREPTLVGTFGVKGGLLAPPVRGKVGDLRFNNITGLGVDRAGNINVASSRVITCGADAVLESYDPSGKLRWRHLGLCFLDGGDIDPGSQGDCYIKDKHFTLDYTQPPGSDWSYTGYTVDRMRYPDDPRLHTGGADVYVRRIDGKRYLFVTDFSETLLEIFRFDPANDGEIAIPCGIISRTHYQNPDKPDGSPYPVVEPAQGEWIWCDDNGDGKIDAGEIRPGNAIEPQPFVPDEDGSVWDLTKDDIRRIPVSAVGKNGVLQYDYAKAQTWPKPKDLDEVRRLRYDTSTDTLYLGGNKGDDHNQHWKPMGPVMCAYDHWLHHGAGGPTLRWKTVLPLVKVVDPLFTHEPMSFDVAGDYVFVAYTQGLPAEGLKEAFVKVVRCSDGSVVGNLVSENETGTAGLLDLWECVKAAKLANGNYIALLEDDAKAKLIMYRWKP